MTERSGHLEIQYQEDLEGDKKHVSTYFRLLRALPDVAEKEKDTIEVRIGKAKLHLARLIAIYQLIPTPGFRVLDQHFNDVLRVIDGEKIWEALSSGSKEKIDEVRANKRGLELLFEFFDGLPEEIEKMTGYINQLSGKPEDNPLNSEELY